jgi:OOP family OmpA-OmpF porin
VNPDMIAVSGEGPDRPVADNRTPEGRARNRRIEFKVVQ